MFILSNFLYAVARILQIFIYLEIAAVILSALLSWVTPYQYYPFRNFVDTVANIVTRPLRKVIPVIGSVDITPMIAVLVLSFLDLFLVRTLMDLAVMLR